MATIRDQNGKRILLGTASWIAVPPPSQIITPSVSPGSGVVGTPLAVIFTPAAPWTSTPISISQSGVSGSFAGGVSTLAVSVGTTTPAVINFTPSTSGTALFNATLSGWTSSGPASYTANSAGTPTLLHSFSLTNNNASGTSKGFQRAGVPFKPSDVPAGSSVVVKRGSTVIDAHFDERAYRNPSGASYAPQDGSLHGSVMHLRDTDFSASEVRTYDIWSVPGTDFTNVGTKTLSDITSGHDFKVVYTSLTETNDASTTTTVGSGTFTASFNSHASVATRTEKFHVGPVCEGWMVWGMATDNTGGAADAHLKVNHYVDIWKNSDGSIYGYEYTPESAQDWWSVANKRTRNYTATVKDGSTTLVTYSSVVHPYKSRWVGVQNSGGLERGKRIWVGGAAPTLTYKPDRSYWIAAGVAQPYKLTDVPAAWPTTNNTTYVPCATADQRGGIDAPGDYDGRGNWPNTAAMAFIRQDAAAMAVARINGFAGLGCNFGHYRSNANRTRPGESADVANTPVSQIMDHPLVYGTGTQVPYNFTSVGMPAPAYHYSDGRTPSPYDGYVQPQGPSPYWGIDSGDPSHSVNYSGFMYQMDGERYLLESVLDQANNMVCMGIGNYYSARPFLAFNGNYSCFPGVSIPTDGASTAGQYDAVAIYSGGQERSSGWVINCMGMAAGLVPDNHVASGYFKRLNRQQSIYLHDSLAYLPAQAKAAGVMPWIESYAPIANFTKRWMSNFTPLCGYMNYDLTGDTDILAWSHMIANPTWATTDAGPYGNSYYQNMSKPKNAAWDATTNPFFVVKPKQNYIGVAATASTDVFGPWDIAQVVADPPANGPANGDVFYWQSNPGNTLPKPAGITEGTPYYVINLNTGARTFQLSATLGGSAVDITADCTQTTFSCFALGLASYTPLHTSGNDSDNSYGYTPLTRAVMVNAYMHGHPLATLTTLNKMQSFLSTMTVTLNNAGAQPNVCFNLEVQ
jgi:hypothetical protein